MYLPLTSGNYDLTIEDGERMCPFSYEIEFVFLDGPKVVEPSRVVVPGTAKGQGVPGPQQSAVIVILHFCLNLRLLIRYVMMVVL